jgi:hypothetical protein
MEMMPMKPERKAQLEAYAQQHGQSAADALDDLLAAQLNPEPQGPEQLSHEEWVRKLRARGERNAGKNIPVLSNEALRRENMYEDRGL